MMRESRILSTNRLIAIGLVALVAVALIAAGGRAQRAIATHPGTTVLVDAADGTGDGGGCGEVANPCDTIQTGIDHATAGDTVSVATGTYTESLTIDKSLTLSGDTSGGCPGPGVNAPVLNGGGAVGSAITIVGGVSNVTIEGLEITNYRNRTLGDAWTTGGIGSAVLAWDATAIDDVTVRYNNMHDLGWSAVLVGNEGQALHDNWLVECNEVADVAAYAIELTNTANSSVIDNAVTGGTDVLGETDDDSQDGILIQTQIHTGTGLTNSTITVDGNTVSGPLTRAGVELLAWDSTDSLTAALNDVTVSNNRVSGSAIGTYIFPVLSNATISAAVTGNVLDSNEDGIQLREFGGGTLASIDVELNDIINSTGTSSGVRVRSDTATANIAVTCNNITGNALLGVNNEGTGTLDAEFNWWGAADGPSGPAGAGSGDGVSANVDFDPFLTNPIGASGSPCNPNIEKAPRLANLWLCNEGICDNKESGVGSVNLELRVDGRIPTRDPKCLLTAIEPTDCERQTIGSFEFEIRYDAKYVTVDLTPGDIFDRPDVECDKFRGEGFIQAFCVTKGKPIDASRGPGTLGVVHVRPTADVYKLLIPNQENGIVTQLINQNCQLSDLQGHPIETNACENAAITIRYLEGDVHSDCVIDVMDQQQVAFRWGAQLGNLLYDARYDLEPSFPQADGDIDAKDLQFVYGRRLTDTSTCKDPHPPQPPVDPQVKVGPPLPPLVD